MARKYRLESIHVIAVLSIAALVVWSLPAQDTAGFARRGVSVAAAGPRRGPGGRRG